VELVAVVTPGIKQAVVLVLMQLAVVAVLLVPKTLAEELAGPVLLLLDTYLKELLWQGLQKLKTV
tara:strand:+ start:562 stop:756 length:195 start_codon:yes stop_codon:yes gene_type:complete